MKIFLVAETFWPKVDGCAVFTQRLAAQLRKAGHQAAVMAPSLTMRQEWFEHGGALVCGIPSLPTFLYKDLRTCLPWFCRSAVAQVIKEWKPDVIHIQNHFFLGSMALQVARKEGIPIMGTNHFMPENLLHFIPATQSFRLKVKNWAWGQFRKVFNHLAVITTPTHAAAALLTDIQFERPVQVISNGIDLARFNPNHSAGDMRKKYGIPGGPILLYVGRLDQEKNLNAVLRALPEALAKVDFHFVLAGSGVERPRLEQLASELGIQKHITFAGFVPDDELPQMYRIADCFMMAGTAELQSIATMEAMASGLPVVAADALALPELVHHEKNGYLFKPNDQHDLARCLISMFSDDAKRGAMAQESLAIIRGHDTNVVTQKFLDLYASLV